MAKTKEELREARKQKLPTATTFSPRNSLSKLSSPLGSSKEFAIVAYIIKPTTSHVLVGVAHNQPFS